jgi:2-hydroxychromene-2-carboxylate isomerase
MADMLFRAEDLSVSGCERMAEQLGFDLAAFRACTRAERITARLDADAAVVESLGIRGLPTYWIGAQVFEGQSDAKTVRAAIDAALATAKQGS